MGHGWDGWGGCGAHRVHIDVVLGARLEELNAVLLRKLLTLLFRDHLPRQASPSAGQTEGSGSVPFATLLCAVRLVESDHGWQHGDTTTKCGADETEGRKGRQREAGRTHPLVLHVTLVPDQDFVHMNVRVLRTPPPPHEMHVAAPRQSMSQEERAKEW